MNTQLKKEVLTKEEVLKRIEKKDFRFFYVCLYNGDYAEDEEGNYIRYSMNCKTVQRENHGDGNDYFITFQFPDFDNMYVTLSGTYSSWDSPNWYEVYLSEPYQYMVTDYRKLQS